MTKLKSNVKTVTAKKPAAVKPVAALVATTPVQMTLLKGVKAIEDACVSISRRGATLQQDIHVAACSGLKHVGEHSDIRLIETLLKACPDMTRRNAIRDWFTAFGPVTFENNAAKFIQGGRTLLGDAMSKPFWSFSPEKPYVAVDLAALIGSTIKKLERDEKETKVSHGVTIAALAKLVPANALAA